MRESIAKTVTGFCPFCNSEREVILTYSYVPRLGETRKEYKASSLECDQDACSESYCPIIKEHILFVP